MALPRSPKLGLSTSSAALPIVKSVSIEAYKEGTLALTVPSPKSSFGQAGSLRLMISRVDVSLALGN
jgi:hypothetical protein